LAGAAGAAANAGDRIPALSMMAVSSFTLGSSYINTRL